MSYDGLRRLGPTRVIVIDRSAIIAVLRDEQAGLARRAYLELAAPTSSSGRAGTPPR